MKAPVHVLICEDSEDDAALMVERLRRGGLDITWQRVDSREAAAAALRERPPDVMVSDHSMPAFSADDALRLLRGTGRDVPFILVSGRIGEEAAAALMRAGAHDFIRKDRLTRLAPAVQRELREAEGRHRQRLAEAALRESEARFRLFAEHSLDVIFRHRVHPRSEIEYVSPAAAQVLGRPPERLLGDPEVMLSAVDPEDRPALAASWASPAPATLVTRWRRPDGSTVWTGQRAVGVRDESGRLVAVEGTLRDITERVVAQRERDRLTRQLRRAERMEALGNLAGGIAHDFNNLLEVILGNSDLLLATLPGDSAGRPRLESIRRAAERGADLTGQLRVFSHSGPSKPETLDLNTIVADVERLLEHTLGEDVDLVTRTAPGACLVRVDRGRFERVLLNLVTNARQAMPRGGRLLIETDATPAADGGGAVRLRVTDTGCGMTPDVLRQAFEPFFTTKGPGHGSGFGLSTAYGTVTDAGGEITLESEPGSGTVVTVTLPAADGAVAAEPSAAGPAEAGGGEAVLLVEDDPDVRDLVGLMLRGAGYRPAVASSPADALDLLARGAVAPDLVLTDVVMPGMTGLELAERLRRDRPALPVLLVSGHTADSLPGDATLPALTSLLHKPFTSAALRHAIAALLSRRT